MRYEVGNRFWVAATLAFVSAIPSGTAQDLPPIERAADLRSNVWLGLVPGLPLGPYKPDLGRPTVGIIDSGVQADHPQLDGLIVAARDFTGEGLQDDFHHGTIVALELVKSLLNPPMWLKNELLAAGLPIAPSPIMSAKVVGKAMVPNSVTVQRMVAAIQWLKQQGVRVIVIAMAIPGETKDFVPLCDAIVAAEETILFNVVTSNAGPSEVVYPMACTAKNMVVAGPPDHDGQIPLTTNNGTGTMHGDASVEVVSLFEYHRREGDRLAHEGKYDEARAAYRQALNASPTQDALGYIRYAFGFLMLKQGQPEEALKDFWAAIALAPKLAEAYVAAGLVLTDRGDFEDAVRLLQGAIVAGVDTDRVRDSLARALIDLDRPKEALEQIDVLRRLNPRFEGLNDLARAAHSRISILSSLERGWEPQLLFWALIETGDGDLVAFLTRNAKVDVDTIPEGTQAPPIVRAALKKQHGIVAALLRAKAKIDASDPTNRITALMAATHVEDATLLHTLLEAGASVDLVSEFGFTALMFAAEQGSLQCVEILLASGADPFLKSDEGKTAFDYATERGNPYISAELERVMKAQHKVP